MSEDKQFHILLVEDGQYYMYGEALRDAFKEVGYFNTELFSWKNQKISCRDISSRVQCKLACGPEVYEVNRMLWEKVSLYKPNFVFLYRCRIIYAKTVKKIKNMGVIVFSYNNDNPFSDFYLKYY